MTESTSIYVGNLAWAVKWQDLKDHMRQAGEVQFAEIMELNGRSKGCGIVQFTTPEEAKKAIDLLNNSELMGRKIFVREDREKSQSQNNNEKSSMKIPQITDSTRDRQLFVKDLAWSVTSDELFNFFGGSEKVEIAKIITDKFGRSRGVGYVLMKETESAKKAVAEFNNKVLKERTIQVKIDKGKVKSSENQ